MSREKRLRLIQVAKKFKVSLRALADFLQQSDVRLDCSPNSVVERSVYDLLSKEFGANCEDMQKRASVQERASEKLSAASLNNVAVKLDNDNKSNQVRVLSKRQYSKSKRTKVKRVVFKQLVIVEELELLKFRERINKKIDWIEAHNL